VHGKQRITNTTPNQYIWPWPCRDDLHMRTWHRYSEDVQYTNK